MKAVALAASVAALVLAHEASAATYDFGVIGDNTTYTSNTINHPSSGSFSDYFTFSTVEYLDEFSTGAFTEKAPFGIDSATLTLYSGLVGAGTKIISSGAFDPMTDPIPTIGGSLEPGRYYVESDVTIPTGDRGSYSVTATTAVSAAPEPVTWALMVLGLGGIGLMMRRAKNAMNFRFKDALTV